MPEVKNYSADEMSAYLAGQYGYDVADIVTKVNGWLARGDGIAVYVNQDMTSADLGSCQLASYGSSAATFESDEPPARMPDTAQSVNWRYLLEGTYRGASLTVPSVNMLDVPASRNPRRVNYACAMDNYEPVPRKVEYGSLVAYDDDSEISGQVRYMRDINESSIPAGSIFIIDDGKSARPYHGGTAGPTGHEILYPFAVNPDGKLRPDGRVIDYANLFIGPRKAYHLRTDS